MGVTGFGAMRCQVSGILSSAVHIPPGNAEGLEGDPRIDASFPEELVENIDATTPPPPVPPTGFPSFLPSFSLMTRYGKALVSPMISPMEIITPPG